MRLALPLLAVVALSAGCGGDDNGSLSYDETGDELAAICQEYDTAAEEEKLTGDVDDDAAVLAEINDQTEQALEEIRALDVDEQLADARDDLASVAEQSLERGRTLERLAEQGDQSAYLEEIRELQRSAGRLNAEAEAAAAAVGAPECGQNE